MNCAPFLDFLFGGLPVGCPAGPVPPARSRRDGPPVRDARGPLAVFNIGGVRSRQVSQRVSHPSLSAGSPVLGCVPRDSWQLPSAANAGGSLRAFAQGLLEAAGFATPEAAWDAHRDALPTRCSLVVEDPSPPAPPTADESTALLRAALVLGRCCGHLFGPDRPLIWSERRLARRVRLVDLEATTFTRDDHA